AVRPPAPQFPAGTKPAPVNQPRAGEAPVNTPEAQAPTPAEQPSSQTGTQPSSQITTAQPSLPKNPAAEDTGREPFQTVVNVNLVTVPVTVKDRDNRLVDGLLRKDFILYE